MRWFRIEASFFVAGGTFQGRKVDKVAPIIKYMKDWSAEDVVFYCNKRKWKIQILESKA